MILYPSLNEVEIVYHAFNGGKKTVRRGNVIEIKDVLKFTVGKKETYHSLGRFSGLKSYIKSNHNSIYGLSNTSIPIYYDYIIIDIDNIVPEDVQNFIMFLNTQYDVQIDSLKIFYSGNKGFHIYIPSILFNLQPAANLNLVVGEIVKRLTEGIIKYDPSLYNKDRYFRANNTFNIPGGKYKIQITYNELNNLNLIYELAKKTRFLEYDYNFSPNEKLLKLYKQCEKFILDRNNDIPAEHYSSLRNTNVSIPFQKLCIINMLKGGGEKDGGGRHDRAFRIAAHFKRMGMDFEVVKGLLAGWNNLNNPQIKMEDIMHIIHNVYSKDFDIGCRDEVMAMNCSSNCFLYKGLK